MAMSFGTSAASGAMVFFMWETPSTTGTVWWNHPNIIPICRPNIRFPEYGLPPGKTLSRAKPTEGYPMSLSGFYSLADLCAEAVAHHFFVRGYIRGSGAYESGNYHGAFFVQNWGQQSYNGQQVCILNKNPKDAVSQTTPFHVRTDDLDGVVVTGWGIEAMYQASGIAECTLWTERFGQTLKIWLDAYPSGVGPTQLCYPKYAHWDMESSRTPEAYFNTSYPAGSGGIVEDGWRRNASGDARYTTEIIADRWVAASGGYVGQTWRQIEPTGIDPNTAWYGPNNAPWVQNFYGANVAVQGYGLKKALKEPLKALFPSIEVGNYYHFYNPGSGFRQTINFAFENIHNDIGLDLDYQSPVLYTSRQSIFDPDQTLDSSTYQFRERISKLESIGSPTGKIMPWIDMAGRISSTPRVGKNESAKFTFENKKADAARLHKALARRGINETLNFWVPPSSNSSWRGNRNMFNGPDGIGYIREMLHWYDQESQFEQIYVGVTGSALGLGTRTSPYSFKQMMQLNISGSLPLMGKIVNMQNGIHKVNIPIYSSASGSRFAPIIFRATDHRWDEVGFAYDDRGRIVHDLATIECSGSNSFISMSTGTNIIWQNIGFMGSATTTNLLRTSSNNAYLGCKFAATGLNTNGIQLMDRNTLVGCEIYSTGTSVYGLSCNSSPVTAIGCFFQSPGGTCVSNDNNVFNANYCTFINSKYGISNNGQFTNCVGVNNTFYNIASGCLNFMLTHGGQMSTLIGNVSIGCGQLISNGSGIPVLKIDNRVDVTGQDSQSMFMEYNRIIHENGANKEFVNPSGEDFRLSSAAKSLEDLTFVKGINIGARQYKVK